jgi:hypothetical protein
MGYLLGKAIPQEVYSMRTLVSSQSPGVELGRLALRANGVFSSIIGLALLLASQPVASFLGIDAPVALAALGLATVLYAAFLLWAAGRQALDMHVVLVTAILDAAWVVLTPVLLLTDWLPFTEAGKWAIVIVSDIVAVFAVAEFYAVLQSGRPSRSGDQ